MGKINLKALLGLQKLSLIKLTLVTKKLFRKRLKLTKIYFHTENV